MASIPFLKFSFSFEQFFPQGDKDLEFFLEFIEEFETDDNFLIIAVKNSPSIFNQDFIEKFSDLTKEFNSLPYIKSSESLASFRYPVKTPFGISSIPAISKSDTDQLKKDSLRLIQDERIYRNFISKDGQALAIMIKTKEQIGIGESAELMDAIYALLDKYDIQENHILGRAFFQDELSKMQKREVIISGIFSILIVSIILVFLYRKLIGVLIALGSISLALFIFFGVLSVMGRELNAIAAFYPVLMLIVGTSDVIHIMSKYLDELKKGHSKEDSIITTIKEIGLATLLTSLTTAAGFASLLTSKLMPIRDFGVNAALGVIIAYITVVLFTTAVISLFPRHRIIRESNKNDWWDRAMVSWYNFTKNHPIKIQLSSVVFLLICAYGISQVTTNYDIKNNMPIGAKITKDFDYYEDQFAGFRPFELAITLKDNHKVYDKAVVENIDIIEQYLRQSEEVQAVISITSIFKSIHQMMHGNQSSYYSLPQEDKTFKKYQRMIKNLPKERNAVLVSKDQSKTRISTRMVDLGAEDVKAFGQKLENYIETNVDTSLFSVRRTGTGLIIDKNADYVKNSIIWGLGLALMIVSILMGLLFRSVKMLFISLIPNMIPLIFAAAFLGYAGIELEAGISIVFAIVFGIAVDDTIHFLSKYKLSLDKLKDKEEAIKVTFQETGKAICFTTIILFAGFLVMLFSIHPPSIHIGLIISITLISALVGDLMLLPPLLRKLG